MHDSTLDLFEHLGIPDDDIEALLLNSYKCKIIKSSPANIKLTYKEDIKNIKELL